VVALHAEEIFDYLFDLKGIRRLRRTHHFRFSFQTDGVGVALGFGRCHRYVPSQSKKETEAPVTSLAKGIAYHYPHKTLGVQGFKALDGWTVRAVDPGVRRVYTSIDLLTEDTDVRHAAKLLRSRAWYQRSGSKQYSAQMKKRHERALADVQHKLNCVPFRRTADPAKFGRYVDALTEPMTWDALQRYAKYRVLRKDRFQAKKHLQRALDHKVGVLCKPREGTDQTLLLYGNGASSNIFRKVKNTAKGPAKKLFDQAVRRKKAVCIW
ncbi:MAG: hypothetical protein GY879_02965, partial [Planctomycetes bacterium]|nr:hypothetical protein [Planctomycetota bacterium]